MDEEGNIDPAVLAAWNIETRQRASEAGRLSATEHMLGEAYARFASRQAWEKWLPVPVADILDQPDSSKLQEGFAIGVHNSRGVTTRGPYDGGAQERQIGAKFREAADRYSLTHPRLAASIRDVAASYDRQASQNDD
jgi:hypothetical protein